MYKLQDISVIIPTFNRAEDLKITLKSIQPYFGKIREIIIVDQSNEDSTIKLVNQFSGKAIKYVFSKKPSITIARNLGVKRTAKSSRIICFIDDDVSLKKGYFEEILNIFNIKNAKAVAAYDSSSYSMESRIENWIKKIFLLGRRESNRTEIVSAYGNLYPLSLSTTIQSQWLPGVNMCFLKEVFKEQQFDENLIGYTVAEDIDFTHRLYLKHPGSIYITPEAKILHRFSQKGRYPTKRISYVNQVDHFYFNFKNLNKTFVQKLSFFWSLTGIFLLRFSRPFISLRKEDILKLFFFIQSLSYCIINLSKIRSGKVRDFERKLN